MKIKILIPIIILMIAALLPSVVFAEAAEPAEKTSQKEIGWTPFSLPTDQKLPYYAPSGTGLPAVDPSAPAVHPSATPKKVTGDSVESDKHADRNPQDIMDEIIARSEEGVPVKLLSIAVIPYIPDGRPLSCC